MIQINGVLFTIVLFLTILILVWIIVGLARRKLGKDCLNTKQKKEKVSETPTISMDEAQMEYSLEIVQPEMKEPGNEFPHVDHNLHEQPKMQKRLFESIMSGQVDSADEMSFIYDAYSEVETDQQRKTKAIAARFAMYLDNVPGTEPMILVLLHYNIHEEKLVLAIIKVANLKLLSNNEIPDPYVRVDVWIGDLVQMKKKTVVMQQESNPVYNQKMEFPVSVKDLENVIILLTIANYGQGSSLQRGRPTSLHQLIFGDQSNATCFEHWKAVITTNKPIAKWHALL